MLKAFFNRRPFLITKRYFFVFGFHDYGARLKLIICGVNSLKRFTDTSRVEATKDLVNSVNDNQDFNCAEEDFS